MAKNYIILECDECKNRNYRINRSKEKQSQKLKIKKFCKHCQKHTLHVQT